MLRFLWFSNLKDSLKKINNILKDTGLHYMLLIVVISMLIGISGLYYFEIKHNREMFQGIGDLIWWAFVTITTVGYGDKYPVTTGGRIIAVIVMVLGIMALCTIFGAIATLIMEISEKRRKGMLKVKCSNHIIIACWNNNAKLILQELCAPNGKYKYPIVIIDMMKPFDIPDNSDIRFVKGNPALSETLDRANIQEARKAIILAKNSNDPASDEKTVLTVLAIEKINPDIYTCAELVNPQNNEHLQRAGCDEIINTSVLSNKLMAQAIEDPGVSMLINELISNNQGNTFYKVKISEEILDQFGTTFGELYTKLKKKENMSLIGYEDTNGKIVTNPDFDIEIEKGFSLFCISSMRPKL